MRLSDALRGSAGGADPNRPPVGAGVAPQSATGRRERHSAVRQGEWSPEPDHRNEEPARGRVPPLRSPAGRAAPAAPERFGGVGPASGRCRPAPRHRRALDGCRHGRSAAGGAGVRPGGWPRTPRPRPPRPRPRPPRRPTTAPPTPTTAPPVPAPTATWCSVGGRSHHQAAGPHHDHDGTSPGASPAARSRTARSPTTPTRPGPVPVPLLPFGTVVRVTNPANGRR